MPIMPSLFFIKLKSTNRYIEKIIAPNMAWYLVVFLLKLTTVLIKLKIIRPRSENSKTTAVQNFQKTNKSRYNQYSQLSKSQIKQF